MRSLTSSNAQLAGAAHLWLGSLEVEYSGTGAATKTIAHVSLDRPIARIEDRVTAKRVVHGQFGHFLGAFTGNAVALDVAFIYGPFGEILAQSGDFPDTYAQRFNGEEQDQFTDLSYYGARYFDPLSLTWTQGDPLYRFAPDLSRDQPRRSNLYAFSLQNPMRFTDGDGQDPKRGSQGVRVLVLYGKDQGGLPLRTEKQRTQFRRAAESTYSSRYARGGRGASVTLTPVGNAADVKHALRGSKSNVVIYLGHAEKNNPVLRPSGPADSAAVTPRDVSGAINSAAQKPQSVEIHACFTDENGFGKQLKELQPDVQVTVYHGDLAVGEQCARGGQSATDCRLQYKEGKSVKVQSKKGKKEGTDDAQ